MREQSWWLLCVSEAKQGSKQAQVPSEKCSGALVPLYIRNMQGPVAVLGSRTLHAPAVPLGCVQCVQVCTVPRGSAGSPLPPPDSSGRGRAPPTTDRSAVIQRAVAGSGFPFYRCSVPPGRSGGRPRRRAGGGSRTRSPQQYQQSRGAGLEAPAPGPV